MEPYPMHLEHLDASLRVRGVVLGAVDVVNEPAEGLALQPGPERVPGLDLRAKVDPLQAALAVEQVGVLVHPDRGDPSIVAVENLKPTDVFPRAHHRVAGPRQASKQPRERGLE